VLLALSADLMARHVLLALSMVVVLAHSSLDLRRAHQRTPRHEYRGWGRLVSANTKLNSHLKAQRHITVKACEEFNTTDLRALSRHLFSHAAPDLRAIYSQADGRRAQYATIAEMEAEWTFLPSDDPRVRDAHCHEAVMWYVHHLTSAKQSEVRASFVLPLLPVTQHTVHRRSLADTAGLFYDSKVTCQDCHIAGIGEPPPEPHPPFPQAKTAWERSRRCDTNWEALFAINCGPCDGLDGIATGADDKYYNRTECEVVALPSYVHEADRVKIQFPEMFTVEVVGSSDHFAGKTPSSPILFSKSHGMMYADVRRDSDVWLLRHETNTTSVFENGVSIPIDSPYTAEVHAQTLKHRTQGITGPQVEMKGMRGWQKPKDCICHRDIVGVPIFQAMGPGHMQNWQYMGRIRLPELEFVGGAIELDHWANWFFHIFMDTNKSSPHYGKAPSRISDNMDVPGKNGFSVYGQWDFGDPASVDPNVWHRGLPAEEEEACPNTDDSPECVHISQSTFPPKSGSQVTGSNDFVVV